MSKKQIFFFLVIPFALLIAVIGVGMMTRQQRIPARIPPNTELLEVFKGQSSLVGMELRITNERIRQEVLKVLERNDRGVTDINRQQYEYLLKVKNLAPPKITIRKNNIQISVFIDLALYGVPIKKKGLPERQLIKQSNVRFTGRGRFSFDWQISINSDWTVQQNLTWNHDWEKAPWLYFKGLYLPVASVITNKLNQIIKKSNNTLTQKMTELLQEQATIFWKEMQEPKLLNADPSVWLRFIPNQIHLPPFENENDDFVWPFAISGKYSVWVADEPPRVSYLPLADINTKKISGNFFYLRVPIISDLSFIAKNMETTVKEFLAQEDWKYLRGEVTDISVYATEINGEKHLVISQDIKFYLLGFIPISGTFYFIGEPVWDSATATLVISNIRWISKTQNLFERYFLKGLGVGLSLLFQNEWKISLLEKKNEALGKINERISFTDKKNSVIFKNNVEELGFTKLFYNSDYIVVFLEIRGSLSITLF